jgi:hypothetical protein
MQRKIFRIDGAPHLATRDGSFFETAATLQRLIAAHQAGEAQQQPDLAAREASNTAVPSSITQPEPEALPLLSAAPPATVPETPARLAEEPAPVVAAVEKARPGTPRCRSRHQRAPGWMTAGAERRGRVDQHWSARVLQ